MTDMATDSNMIRLPKKKVMAALYLTLRGLPSCTRRRDRMKRLATRKEDVKDPIVNEDGEGKRRDGDTHPHAMDGGENAGSVKPQPWLPPVPPTYKTHNVAAESQQPIQCSGSTRSSKLRTPTGLLDGSYTPLH